MTKSKSKVVFVPVGTDQDVDDGWWVETVLATYNVTGMHVLLRTIVGADNDTA